jgi:DNA-binding CsgD family transcriptional regulator
MHNTAIRLTRQEERMLSLTAVGLSVKEIGDKICVSPYTAQNTLHNIKDKLGLQKATELAAYYWCKLFEVDYAEVKKKVLATTMFILFGVFVAFSADESMLRARRLRIRRQDVEYLIAA